MHGLRGFGKTPLFDTCGDSALLRVCLLFVRKKSPESRALFFAGAQERNRTSTVLPPLGPEPSASTNFATWAFPAKAEF